VRKRGGGKRGGKWGREKNRDVRGEIKQREKKNRRGREKELPKDWCAISENCGDLFVKQNFPLI
jgi:hypothetical protein